MCKKWEEFPKFDRAIIALQGLLVKKSIKWVS